MNKKELVRIISELDDSNGGRIVNHKHKVFGDKYIIGIYRAYESDVALDMDYWWSITYGGKCDTSESSYVEIGDCRDALLNYIIESEKRFIIDKNKVRGFFFWQLSELEVKGVPFRKVDAVDICIEHGEICEITIVVDDFSFTLSRDDSRRFFDELREYKNRC